MEKTILITGANSGIGWATAQELAKAGHKLILWARTEEKAAAAREKLLVEAPNADLDLAWADLADVAAVAAEARRICNTYSSLDVLINNAGYYPSAIKFTNLGVEETLWASHFGHYVLTLALEPILARGRDARVVNVSSTAHIFGDADRFFMKGAKTTFQAYSDAKLANILFTLGLRKRWAANGIGAYSLHPGVIDTNLPEKATGIFKFFFKLAKPFLSKPEKGAITSLYLAMAGQNEIGTTHFYFEKAKGKKVNHRDFEERVVDWFWEKTAEVLRLNYGL